MMKRRSFIRNSAIAAGFPLVLGALSGCNFNKPTKGGNKVFVLIQLVGGNDGLNTLIPLDNYSRIAKARPNLYIPEDKILPLKGTNVLGLHPAMAGIRDLYDNDLVRFVQGVGYNNLVFSHFRSMDIWLTGSDSKILDTGWMARFLEKRYKNYPAGFPDVKHPEPPAIKIGDTGTFLFQGEEMDLSVMINPTTGFHAPEVDLFTDEDGSFADVEMKSISRSLLQTQKYAQTIEKSLKTTFTHSSLYPKQGENPLADQLKIVSQLINAGLQTSVYMVDLKGFDTHQEQVDKSNRVKGAHADLLSKLSQAITCFWDDINHMGRENDVTGMTFSEFGRRIISNASTGTDHGSSQPILFFGAGVEPGILGNNPTIPDQVTVEDNLAVQYDYRSVYATVLKNWLDTDPTLIKDILMGGYPEIKIFK